MKGFPKKIGSGQDLLNLLSMVQAKQLSADDLKRSIATIEARKYITCPIVTISDDRKTATVNYCSEAAKDQIIGNAGGATIAAVTSKTSGGAAPGGMKNTPDQTVITLSAALGAGETSLKIPSAASPLAALGITQDQLNSIKGVLNQL
jgi:hypothetical protein